MSGAPLEIDGVTKRYGDRTALDGVTFSVEAGEICALLGPNGAGKTTLVSIVAGLRDADGGSVRIGGMDITTGGRATRDHLGLAAQETGIYPTVTVRENLVFFAELAGYGKAETAVRVGELAELFELTSLLDRLARELSGGEKRRLHTAMALVHRPTILLLDEPTTGVDVSSRARLLDVVRSLAHEDGCSIFYSTHYLPEVEALDADVVLLDRGRVIARGTTADLIQTHGSGSVTLVFDGSAPPVADATIDGDRLVRSTDRAGSELAELITSLGAETERLRAVEVRNPDLESVFLSLTGRHYTADETGAEPADEPPVTEGAPT